jgi:hypothetical protein
MFETTLSTAWKEAIAFQLEKYIKFICVAGM